VTAEGFRLAPQEYDPAIPVEALGEHPRNPNQGDTGAIHLSMGAHGYYGGILVHRGTGNVIRGNHTYRTAVQKGATHIPGFWLDVDDAEAERIMLDDNHAGRLGMDDQSLLAALLVEMASRGELPATYTGDDVDNILAGLEEGLPDGFGSLEENAEPPIPPDARCPNCSTVFPWREHVVRDGQE
jgi:hypothetical protein